MSGGALRRVGKYACHMRMPASISESGRVTSIRKIVLASKG
jgi:hypothetical protein